MKREAAAIVGKKEGEGPFGPLFDKVEEDGFFGKKTWEEAEGELQRQTAKKVLEKAKLTRMDMRYVFAGDLLEQMTASTFGLMGYEIPHFLAILYFVTMYWLKSFFIVV